MRRRLVIASAIFALTALITFYYIVPVLFPKPYKIRMAVEFNNHALCAWVAKHYGWFKDEGLNITYFAAYVTGVELSAAVAKGDVDVAYLCLGPALIAYARGVPIKIVAGTHFYGYGLVVKPDIKSVKDLSGKSIGCVREGSSVDLLLQILIRKYNLTDLDIRRMSPPMQIMALISGKIDGAFLPEFWCTLAVSQGFTLLMRAQDIWPGMQGSVLVVREEYLKKYPEAVRRLVKVTVRATQYIKESPEDSADILIKELSGCEVLGLKPEVLEALTKEMQLVNSSLVLKSMENLGYSYDLSLSNIQEHIDLLYELGYIDERFNATDVVDLTFLEEVG